MEQQPTSDSWEAEHLTRLLRIYAAAFPANFRDRELWPILVGEVEAWMLKQRDIRDGARDESEIRWREACADVVLRNPWGSLPAVFERYETKTRNQMIRAFALPAHQGEPGEMKPLMELLMKRITGEIGADAFRAQVERMAP